MENQMRFVSALTTAEDVEEASLALIDQVNEGLPGQPIDFALVFLSPHFAPMAPQLIDELQTRLQPRVLLGCTGEGVIGRDQEVERKPAVSLVAGALPGVQLTPFSLEAITSGSPALFQQAVAATAETSLFVLLADPFSIPIEEVLETFNTLYPGVPVVGGMASGSARPGGNAMILNNRVTGAGAVGVTFAGEFEVDVIVSQGCRPIGQPYTITAARENIILSLENQPPLTHLHSLLTGLPAEDQALLQNGLFVGRAISPDQETLGRGDFLIRGVMGLDRESGALVVGDQVQTGETIQFHLRDAKTAEEDLEMMLTPQLFFEPPHGGLLFSCNGRGTRLYPHPNGDIITIQKVMGHLHLAGFFCAGEIGPIGGKNFLHGHTASMALFRPRGSEN